MLFEAKEKTEICSILYQAAPMKRCSVRNTIYYAEGEALLMFFFLTYQIQSKTKLFVSFKLRNW